MARATQSLLIGTTKGAFVLDAGPGRRTWQVRGPFHFGSVVNDVRLDPRDGRTLLASASGGHLGPTVYVSTDRGRKWKESKRPPRFAKGKEPKPGKRRTTRGLAVKSCFWLEPGHADERGVWYLGTTPAGLFRSEDGGRTWRGIAGLNEGRIWGPWNDHGRNETPGGSILHSIQIDPRDKRHMYASISGGGTCETRDQGRTWKPLSKGLENDLVPSTPGDFGHDPHCMIVHPAAPDRLYVQSHFGIYALDRRDGERWTRIGRNMPKAIGDIGFPMVGHPTDPETVFVFPMDGTRVWPRTSPGGKPAVYRTRDGGASWQRCDRGLPKQHAWYTVKRQCMCADRDPARTGVYFGTTSGDVWASRDGANSWKRIAEGLPHIYSVRWAEFR
jgi:photosystem II stability/assembly factor-like uncharacterized protein